ncbi:S-adenosylmethionine decarboxylase proenzyme [Gossypium arboreum]|uniref:S-adenosylmethionine decarboxylase proenzyme n=1 Tax=Gossypium arboreum TaxID=29729 RepID=A0A0B0MEA4_GOSAR|nr:S-adenosylmethionine decarboxylase proenzyme [Gossypium arboreum]
MKSVCSTRSHTRVWHGLAHKHVWRLRRQHGLDTWACGWPCDPSQYVCPISTRPEARACLEPCEAHVMDPDRAIADEVESNAPAHVQGAVPSDSRPETDR